MQLLKAILLLLLACLSLTQGQVASDRTALQALYDALGGPSWTVTWNFSQNLCLNSAKTVSCDSKFNVVEVNLANRGLVGTIPPGIANFTSILRLYLHSNPSLTGNLPTEIGQLTTLTAIQVYGCGLNGQIPTQIGKLSKLTSLRLYNNFITGTLPTELGSLTFNVFNDLQLHNNLMTGTLPTELAKLKALVTMTLQKNQLTGAIPTEFATFPKIASLDLYDNLLTGGIPTEFALNQVITRFWVAGNQLSGTIPFSTFAAMTKLQYLYLERNNFTGPIGTEIGQLPPSVFSVRIMQNQLDGSIPTQISSLNKLGEFYIFGNQISGSLPTEIGNLSSLERLWIWSNKIGGSIPTEVGNMKKLTLFRAQDNAIEGSLPTQLADIPVLQNIWLNDNKVSGSIPTELGKAPALQQLLLSGNNLTGSIPSELGNIAPLQRLIIASNGLSGSIPTQLGNLPNLQEFNMSSNAVEGSVPSELGNLSKLQKIDLTNNNFVGTFPEQLLNVPAGQQIMLVKNCLLDVPDYTFFGTYDYPGFHDLPVLTTCPKGAYESVVLADNPVAFFRFEQHRPAYDHATQTDLLTNPFGTFRYARADSAYNYALVNGGNATAQAVSNVAYTFTTGFSMEIIIEAKTLINVFPFAFNPNVTNTSSRTLNLRINSNKQIQIFSAGSQISNAAFPASIGTSYHIVVTHNKANNRLITYLNGAVLSNGTWSMPNAYSAGQYLVIGPGLNGYIDEIAVFNTVLSPTRVKAHYDALQVCTPNPCGTRKCYANSRRSTQCEIDPDQKAALVALYNATTGASWGFPSWDTTDDLCKYNFTTSNSVYCDAAGNVIHLELVSKKMVGTLPSAFFALPKLAYLNIRSNINLTSTIPTEIGTLSSIRYLSLTGNGLSGEIPTEIGNLPKALNVSLCCQSISGSLPTQIANIPTLRMLGVHLNKMSGTIPDMFTTMTALNRLELYSNSFTGTLPSSFAQLKNMQVLAISSNKFNGTFPTVLLNLNKLWVLIITDNEFTGTIPTEIATFNLVGFDISMNKFSGTIPPAMVHEPLKSFVVNNNYLSGPIPPAFETLSSMRNGIESKLFLGANNFDCPPVNYTGWAVYTDYNTYLAGCP